MLTQPDLTPEQQAKLDGLKAALDRWVFEDECKKLYELMAERLPPPNPLSWNVRFRWDDQWRGYTDPTTTPTIY